MRLESRPVATLVTGVGYIGAPLLRRLSALGERLVALEDFSTTSRETASSALPEGTPLVEGDIARAQDVARAFDAAADTVSRVFHLAAQPSAAIAAREPELTERSNLTGARVVLEAAHERGAHVIFGGSFRVYGDDIVDQIVDEDTPYGRVGDLSHLSKVYVEQLARMIGLPFASVRLGVTYGLSPIMKTQPSLMTVPNLFCQKAINGDVLHVLEDRPMGFIHVDDAVDALLAASDQLRESGETWQVFNAAPEVATIGHVARTVQRLAQTRGNWVRIQGVGSEDDGFVVSSRLDFTARRTLETGLPAVLEFFARDGRGAAAPLHG